MIQALRDAWIFGMSVPAVLGGSELTPLEALRVMEQVASTDASTGWVLMATNDCIACRGRLLIMLHRTADHGPVPSSCYLDPDGNSEEASSA